MGKKGSQNRGGSFTGPTANQVGKGTIAAAQNISDGVRMGGNPRSPVPGSQGNKSGSAVGEYPSSRSPGGRRTRNISAKP